MHPYGFLLSAPKAFPNPLEFLRTYNIGDTSQDILDYVFDIVLLWLASALALASGLTLRQPLLDFFWVHQNMTPAIKRSFSTGDLDLQGQGQACRGHHLKNHLN